MISLSPPPVDNSKNKKLHAIVPVVTEAEALEAIYPSDHYRYCFVRYATHEQAQAAFDGMNN